MSNIFLRMCVMQWVGDKEQSLVSALKNLVINRGERNVYNMNKNNKTVRKDHVQRYVLSSVSGAVLIFSILGCTLSEKTTLNFLPASQ